MTAQRTATNMFRARIEISDPGNAGTITVDRNPCHVPLVSAAAETRTLDRPTRTGAFAFLYVQTYAGAITLTVTGGYNVAGSTVYTFGAAGQWAAFVSAFDGTNYYWDLLNDWSKENSQADGMVAAGATLTMTQALHAGKTIKLDTLAGSAVTLPAATGSMARYRFIVTVLATSNSHTITTDGTGTFQGIIMTMSDDSPPTMKGFAAVATSSKTITLNRGTTGSVTVGEQIEIIDIATNIFQVTGVTSSTSTEATPFS